MYTIIVGGGQVGTYLATLLQSEKQELMVIENRRDRYEALLQSLPTNMVMFGSGTDPNILEAAKIQRAGVLAAVTGTDETNLVICSLGRIEFKVPRIIARVNNPKNAWLYTPEMGVDIALNQAELMGHMIVEDMSLGEMMTLFKIRKGLYSIIEDKVDAHSPANGKSIKALPLPSGCLISAIIRKGEFILPHGDTMLQAGDEVLAIVHSSEVSQLAVLLGSAGTK
jgi:trk system potassium uptake protein